MLILCKKGSGWFLGRIIDGSYIEDENCQRMSIDNINDIDKIWLLLDEPVNATLNELGL